MKEGGREKKALPVHHKLRREWEHLLKIRHTLKEIEINRLTDRQTDCHKLRTEWEHWLKIKQREGEGGEGKGRERKGGKKRGGEEERRGEISCRKTGRGKRRHTGKKPRHFTFITVWLSGRPWSYGYKWSFRLLFRLFHLNILSSFRDSVEESKTSINTVPIEISYAWQFPLTFS